MGASDALRALVALGALAGASTLAACFFELSDVVPAGADAGVTTSGSGGSGTGGSGGGTTTTTSGSGGGIPADWWNTKWTRRVKLVLDNATGGAVTDFPLLVTLDATRIDYGATRDDASDLRFVAEGGVVLAHEVDRWDEAGISHVWVRVPSIPASGTGEVWLYFGNVDATDAQDASSLWSAYAAVYHLGNDPTAGGAAMADSTGHGHDGTPIGIALADRVEGRVGQAIHFAGVATDAPRVALTEDGGAFDAEPGGGMSFEVWAKREPSASDMFVMMNEGCCEGTAVLFAGTPTLSATFATKSGNCCNTTNYAYADAPWSDGDTDWHYLAVVFDRAAGSMKVFVDGTVGAEQPIPTNLASAATATMNIGTDWSGASGMKGVLDEARFASGPLSADYVDAQQRSMTDQMIDYRPIEQLPQ